MKIESREDLKFKLIEQNLGSGLYILEIKADNNEIELWIINSELEALKEVLNI